MDLTAHLHSACHFGSLEIAQEALDHGARSLAENARGETPLHLVSRGQYDTQEGGVGIIHLLVGRGANVNAQDKGHMTPLHLACYNRKLEIVRALLSHGASVNAKGELGKTALHLVLDGNRSSPDGVRIVRLLLEHGADVNANDSEHKTPLHLASNYWESAIGRVLLIHGANPNAANTWGQTPLHMLSLWPYVEDESRLVGTLVDGGANVNARDDDNDTPLHTAAYTGRLDIVKCLLKRDADDGAKNNKGETPIQLAPRNRMRRLSSVYGPPMELPKQE
jgi:cytohesin